MSKNPKVICESCNEGVLIPLYDSDEVLYGYHCNTVELEQDGPTDQCYTLIPPSQYRSRVKDLLSKLKPTSHAAPTQSQMIGGYSGTPLLTLPNRPLGRAFVPELNRKDVKMTENIATYTKRMNVILKQSGKPLLPIGGIMDDDIDSGSKRMTRGSIGRESLDSDDDEHAVHYDSQASESSSEESEDEVSDETETDTDNRLYVDTEIDRIDDLADAVNFEQAKNDEDYQSTVKALQENTLQVKRQSMFEGLPYAGYLNDQYENYREPFKAPDIDPILKRYIPSDNTKKFAKLGVNYAALETVKRLPPFKVPSKIDVQAIQEKKMEELQQQQQQDMQKILAERPIPKDYKPLVVWKPHEHDLERFPDLVPIEVPPIVGHWLRDHQREGVKFLSECVLEQREYLGCGAILADDMGLGKTLQSVALIYTLLNQGFERGKTICKKIIVACPTSLVSNWANEFVKWIGEGVVNVLPLLEGGKKATQRLMEYTHGSAQVLVLSYEALRRFMKTIIKRDCDLLICDEAHRLKNHETATYRALNELKCRRRVLLSGTPMQNNLNEFYAMVSFANPGVFGDQSRFTRTYITPITRGREPDATKNEKELGDRRALQLGRIVNHFILRRTNHLLSKHLPPKVIQVVSCQLSPLQKSIYALISQQKAIMQLLEIAEAESDVMSLDDIFGKSSSGVDFDNDDDDDDASNSNSNKKRRRGNRGVNNQGKRILPLIGMLKQLCNHPKIIYDSIVDKSEEERDELETNILNIYPRNFLQNGLHPNFSGKVMALDRLMCAVRSKSDDKFVLVSNFTQTLDVLESLCRYRKWSYLRVDGTTNIKQRQANVDKLCAKSSQVVAFLLSSKAGGCGLNLVGANRLVLLDPDWNPAVDKQAAGRIWRDGQRKRCFVYRFLSSGTIDEKIFQRQLSKDGLTEVMGGSNAEATVSTKQLKELFTYSDRTLCDTHDTLKCSCLDPENPGEITDYSYEGNEELFHDPDNVRTLTVIPATNVPILRVPRLQRGWALESDLHEWSHHSSILTMPDPLFRLATVNRYSGTPDASALVLKARTSAAAAAPRKNTRRARFEEEVFLANDKKVPVYTVTSTPCNFQPEDLTTNPVTMVLSLEVTGKPLPNDQSWKHFSSLTFRFQPQEGGSHDPESSQPSPEDAGNAADTATTASDGSMADGNIHHSPSDDSDSEKEQDSDDDGMIPNYDTDEPAGHLPRYLQDPEDVEMTINALLQKINAVDKPKAKRQAKGQNGRKKATGQRQAGKKRKKQILTDDDDDPSDFDGDPNDDGSDLKDFIVNSDDDDDGDGDYHHDVAPQIKKKKTNQSEARSASSPLKQLPPVPSESSSQTEGPSGSQSQDYDHGSDDDMEFSDDIVAVEEVSKPSSSASKKTPRMTSSLASLVPKA